MKKSEIEKFKKEIFLKKSEVRRSILNNLEKPKTATELAKELGKHRSAVSRALIDLEKEGFIICVNPKDKNFRHYVKKQ